MRLSENIAIHVINALHSTSPKTKKHTITYHRPRVRKKPSDLIHLNHDPVRGAKILSLSKSTSTLPRILPSIGRRSNAFRSVGSRAYSTLFPVNIATSRRMNDARLIKVGGSRASIVVLL